MPYPEGLPIFTIWDEIAFHLVSTKDLLSLALTCRDFKELIIPDHLEYRYIACDIYRRDVWKHLGTRPRLTRGIRFVKLFRRVSHHIRLPRRGLEDVACFYPNDLTSVDEEVAPFKELLSQMTFLKELTLIIQRHPIPSQHFTDAFLNIVQSSATPSLEGLFVTSKDDPHMPLDDETVLSPHRKLSVWPLTRLKRVILCDLIQTATQLIHLCPDIEDLYLSELSSASTSYLIPLANWTKLRRLSLEFGEVSIPAEDFSAVMTAFFHRHTSIECLHLVFQNIFKLAVDVPPLYFPKLRSVVISSVASDRFSLTFFLSVDSISRLMHLECPITDVDIDALTLTRMDSLRSFRIAPYDDLSLQNLASFLLKAPNLEKICLDIILMPSFWRDEGVKMKIIHMFLQCPNLTHIVCDISFFEAYDLGLSPYWPIKDFCQSLSPLTALNYLQVYLDSEGTNLKLERDGKGGYSGYQRVTREEAGGEPQYWGDVFLRL